MLDGTPYTGPVAALDHQFISTNPAASAITSMLPSAFIHTGSGDDAIDVSRAGGVNVPRTAAPAQLPGRRSGADTFFVDDRAPAGSIWSTLVGFHAGDSATVWA